MRRILFTAACLGVSTTLLSGHVLSQGNAGSSYPVRAVTVIVPFTPGGQTDVEARLYAAKVSELVGQQFTIDYKPGAGTTVGTGYVAKANPDGYTLLCVTGGFTTFPGLYKDLSFDTLRDFAPIALMGETPAVLYARTTLPARNLVEYIAYARANPGKVNWGTSGPGGISHLNGAWIHGATGVKVTYVAYKATPPMIVDMLAGRLDISVAGIVTVMPLLKSGKLNAMAVSTIKRSKLLPDLATVAEQGVPGFNSSSWMGFSAPGRTPTAVIDQLNAQFVRVTKSPDVIATLEEQGGVLVGSTPAQFRQFIEAETNRWRKLIRDNDIQVEG